ncbi:hypothetical protein P9112_013911 [Eukaryota sp. TZLM1-RC]
MLTVSTYGEQLYDFCLHPTALTYSDLGPPSNHPALVKCQLFPDPIYANYFLSTSRELTIFVPLSLLKPKIHLVYHYDEDEVTPCRTAIPCLEMFHSHQIDLHDRRIHYHYLPLDYHSVFETKDEPQFIHETSHVCSHFEDIRALLFDNPTEYHSRIDFILQDKVLEIIDYSDGRQGFANANRSPKDLPTYYLTSSRFHLPTRRETYPKIIPVSFVPSSFRLPPRRFLVHSLSESSTSSDLIAKPLARNSPARSFLDKLFKEQQKIPDSDPLFVECKVKPQLGLKLTQFDKILVAPSLRPEILLLVHGSTEAGHPAFANCWKNLLGSDFLWAFTKADLTNHVKECVPCQKTAPVPSSFISSTGSLNSAHRPFGYLHCDCIGPLPLDVDESKYVIHFVDAFSKFSILVSSRDLKAQSIVEALIVHVYFIFEAPKAIHSDNGPVFANQDLLLVLFLFEN